MVKIQEMFGVQELPHGLFYSFDLALRFELGGEEFGMERPMRRFTQANERSKAISKKFFENSPEVFVLLSSYGMEQPDKKRLAPLKLCGIEQSEFKYLGKTPQQDNDHISEFGSDLFRHWDVVKLKDRQSISEILWLVIASEMIIEPSFRGMVSAYIVDLSNGLILHVYDDRGMDVIATKYAPLKTLFTTYRTWLLGHDLLQMTAKFEDDT
ncbi:DUF3885 domain-containing protein [Ruegeria sp.]|uniref:DUF3885 domain-containing protein n=1 Tax=Ruegeria sp. TaxID=1879320 RepID=UPI003B5BE9E9